jgi:hypothetical protein
MYNGIVNESIVEVFWVFLSNQPSYTLIRIQLISSIKFNGPTIRNHNFDSIYFATELGIAIYIFTVPLTLFINSGDMPLHLAPLLSLNVVSTSLIFTFLNNRTILSPNKSFSLPSMLIPSLAIALHVTRHFGPR